ncbi:hypothetical protein GCM10009007_03460 [Formosimonas limnophila]|uniref:Dit-like phage tail protein N-terminal domain-containing protein n=1 Tax=Formosimonas limnophila TaxID=1384487 RepID=A0A8J3FZV2_9BURK|nr:hypothetical protein [Formosimonas limnophila]GHA66301.1 hypothetical protein GCM10009007_03460 [Formosimonas limnophila]
MSVLLIPAFGDLFEGVEWNVTMKQSDTAQSDVTQSPIDDVDRPFLVDFNQNKPAQVNVTIKITVEGETEPTAPQGIERMQQCYERLRDLKNKQTTTPDALIDIYMGHYQYENMAITSLSTDREIGKEGSLTVDIGFDEFQFVKVPQVGGDKNILDSNTSRKDTNNKPMHETRDTGHPMFSTGDQNDTAILSAERQRGDVRPITYVGVLFELVRKNMT